MTRFSNSLIHLGKRKQTSSIMGVSVLPPLILEKKFSTKRVKRLSTSMCLMKLGLSSMTFVFSLVRPSSIIFTEFRVVADNFTSGPWVWEVEPLIP